MRNKFERNLMTNKLAVSGLICCIIGTASCVSIDGNKSYLEEECENGICTSNREYTAVCVENADGYSECSDSGNINYTRTAAEFRQYGERSPRDHRITQAGAGNNLSAAIPPSIDNEVVEYETGVANNANGYAPTWNPATGAPVSNQMAAGNPAVPAQAAGNLATPNAPYNGNTGAGGQPQVAQNNRTPNNNSYAANTNGYTGSTQNNTQNGDDEVSAESSTNKDWLAEEGQSLKELLTMWSDEAGWRLIWKTNRNYTLNAGAMFRGNFADVASALIRAFARARPAPVATFYKGNRVLVIETMEDENAYD